MNFIKNIGKIHYQDSKSALIHLIEQHFKLKNENYKPLKTFNNQNLFEGVTSRDVIE